MSIIRFRTAVKDTQDIVYIFFALAIGMAAGGGYHKVAFIGTASVGLMIYLFSRTALAAPRRRKNTCCSSPTVRTVTTSRRTCRSSSKHCRQHQVINTRSLGTDRDTLEISYYVKLRDKEKDSLFVRELRKAHGHESGQSVLRRGAVLSATRRRRESSEDGIAGHAIQDDEIHSCSAGIAVALSWHAAARIRPSRRVTRSCDSLPRIRSSIAEPSGPGDQRLRDGPVDGDQQSGEGLPAGPCRQRHPYPEL